MAMLAMNATTVPYTSGRLCSVVVSTSDFDSGVLSSNLGTSFHFLVAHPLTALTISLATRQLLVGTARERRERVDYEGLAISEATHRDATSRHPSFLIPHSSFNAHIYKSATITPTAATTPHTMATLTLPPHPALLRQPHPK